VVSHALLGNYPAFQVPDYNLVSAWEIPLYGLLGCICGVAARFFVVMLHKGEDLFERIKMPGWLKPGLGGLMLGILGLVFPEVFADGYHVVTSVLHGHGVFWLLIVLVFAKMVATTLTLGSGNSGGTFAPTLFMGTTLGGAYGHLAHSLFPSVTGLPGAYAAVGMGAFVAAAAHAPMTAMMLIFEITRDYETVLPLMIACVLATMIAMRMAPDSMYTAKLLRQGIVIRQGKDVNVLARHTVAEVMKSDIATIPVTMRLTDILHEMEVTGHSDFLVVDSGGGLVGVLGFQEIRTVMTQHDIEEWVIASDIMRPARNVLHPDDPLTEAWDLLRPDEAGALPVVARANQREIVGMVTRDAVTSFYNRRLVDALKPSSVEIGPTQRL
jgi:CIC family chloride channel protein